MQYEVRVFERHVAIYVVDADSPEQAKANVENGLGIIADDSAEFESLIDKDKWTVKEGEAGESLNPADAAFCDGLSADEAKLLSEEDRALIGKLKRVTLADILSSTGVMTYDDQTDGDLRLKVIEYLRLDELSIEQVRAAAAEEQ